MSTTDYKAWILNALDWIVLAKFKSVLANGQTRWVWPDCPALTLPAILNGTSIRSPSPTNSFNNSPTAIIPHPVLHSNATNSLILHPQFNSGIDKSVTLHRHSALTRERRLKRAKIRDRRFRETVLQVLAEELGQKRVPGDAMDVDDETPSDDESEIYDYDG
jgi:hypothetical protein